MSLSRVVAAHRAMGTRFELILYGERERYLQGVAEEVFTEISRLDAKLSYYNDTSDINDLNIHAAERIVQVDPPLYRLLEQAQQWSEKTGGAFDITVAPLLHCWGFVGGMGKMPSPEQIETARECVGMHHVHLYPDLYGVEFVKEGIRIDLGSIGKGYAIDCAAELLRDYEITSALLHGGTSSVYAIGSPPDADTWKIALQKPFVEADGEHIAYISLKDNSLSVSAPRNKGFEYNGKRYGHVLDARTGYPVPDHLLAATVCESALVGDVCSTALLTRGVEWLNTFVSLVPNGQGLFAHYDSDGEICLQESPLPDKQNRVFELIREQGSRETSSK